MYLISYTPHIEHLCPNRDQGRAIFTATRHVSHYSSLHHARGGARANMLILILLLAQASCEWVEISQQHYEKPTRPTHNRPMTATISEESEEERFTKSPNRIYINHSLPEYNWKQGTGFKAHSASNIRRYQLDTDAVKPTSRSKPERNFFIEKPPIQKTEIANFVNKNEIVAVIPKPETVKRNRVVFGHDPRDTFNVKRLNPASGGQNKYSRPRGDYEIDKELEVYNLSEIDRPTGEDIFTLAVDDTLRSDHIKKRLQFSNAKPTRGTKEIVITPLNFETTLYDHAHEFSSEEAVKNDVKEDTIPMVLKFNKMRRVDILQSTEKTPTQFVISSESFNEDFERPVRRHPNLGIITKVQLPNRTSRTTTERNKPNQNRHFVTKIPPKVSSEIITKDLLLHQAKKTKNIPQRSQKARPRDATAKPKIYEGTNENHGFIKRQKVSNYQDVTEEIIVDREKDFSVHLISNINEGDSHESEEDNQGLPKKPVTRHSGPIKTIKVPDPELVMVEEILKDEHLTNVEVQREPHKGLVNRVQHPTQLDKFEKIQRVTNKPVVPLKVVTTKEPSEYEEEDFDENIYTYSTPTTENIETYLRNTEKIPVLMIERPKHKKNMATFDNPSVSLKTENHEHNGHRHTQNVEPPEFVTKENEEEDDQENDVSSTEPNIKIFNVKPTQPTVLEYDRINPYVDGGNTFEPTTIKEDLRPNKEGTNPRENIVNNTKDNTMENVVKLLKVVSETISRNTHKSISSKMRYLQDLKDTIVANIGK